MTATPQSDWNSFARTNASDRWRKQSAMMGTPLTELIVKEAQVERGMSVLDVASGTGEPAISIATLLNGTGEVTATDVSPEPLKVGAQRSSQRGLKNIFFRLADVHQLPFPDDRFDRVTCRLGLMFFSDLQRALAEIRRVLKPGGRFTAVAWGLMNQPYFETTIGVVQKAIPGIEIPASGRNMFKFGQPGTLTKALKEAGFAKADDELRGVEWNWPGPPEDAWEYFQAVTIPFATMIKEIPAERKLSVDEAVVDAMRPLCREQQIHFNGQFTLAIATR